MDRFNPYERSRRALEITAEDELILLPDLVDPDKNWPGKEGSAFVYEYGVKFPDEYIQWFGFRDRAESFLAETYNRGRVLVRRWVVHGPVELVGSPEVEGK